MAEPYAEFATTCRIVADVVNAAESWGGNITDARRGTVGDSPEDDGPIAMAVEAAGDEVIRAICENPAGGYFGLLSVDATVETANIDSGAVKPYFDGVGTPRIRPFAEGPWITGEPATAAEIEDWRLDGVDGGFRYTGVYPFGENLRHNGQGPVGEGQSYGARNPNSCRYNFDRGVFSFTGETAIVPVIRITAAMARNQVPRNLAPAVVKCSIMKLVKPGDALYQIAGAYQRLGDLDKIEIRGGALTVRDIPMPHEIIGQQRPL